MPDGVAAEVVQERKDRLAAASAAHEQGAANTDEGSKFEPLKTGQHPLEVSERQSSSSLPAVTAAVTDTTPLLGSPMRRMNSWGSQTVFKVTSYLGLADDRNLLLQAYDDADAKLDLFKHTYQEEVRQCCYVYMLMSLSYLSHTVHNESESPTYNVLWMQVTKVRRFYAEKTNEISQRMEVLVESVGSSALKVKKQPKRSSIVESITQKFESMMHGGATSTLREYNSSLGSSFPDMAIQFTESLEDDGLDPESKELERKKKKEELLRNSDSIKRAITDIYRTAKLLHNYSIMVSTARALFAGTSVLFVLRSDTPFFCQELYWICKDRKEVQQNFS